MEENKKEKIGLLNFHFSDNYGALLQTYALTKTIEDTGLSVENINFIPYNIQQKYVLFRNPFILIRENGIIKGLLKFLFSFKSIGLKLKRRREFNNFRKKRLNISNNLYKKETIKNMVKDYDVIIVGSDQVWNPVIINGYEDVYFMKLEKKSDLRIVSYAASYGEDEISELDLRNLLTNISHFDYISVREKSLQSKLEIISDAKRIDCHIDPTFLLSSKEYIDIADTINVTSDYILVYDINYSEELIQYVNQLSKITGMGVLSFTKGKAYEKLIGTFRTYSPTQFLTLINNANYVISSSFHGIAFSVIFEKKFVAFPHKKRGSRVKDLLSDLDLAERVYDYQIKKYIDIDQDIDYAKINQKLEVMRANAIDYIRDIVNNNLLEGI